MQRKYEESVNERKHLENRKDIIRLRLQRAADLTEGLDVEKVRWMEQYTELNKKSDFLIVSSLICSAAVNYLGLMTQDYREKLIQGWIKYCANYMGMQKNLKFQKSQFF